MQPCLYLVIPCYNEGEVLPLTAPLFKEKIQNLVFTGKISKNSRVLFVDDGSKDDTWQIISAMSDRDEMFEGIRLSRNKGHQNALLAGLTYVTDKCDISISVDADGQDDINAIDKMVDEYLNGADIVYGVRSSRKSDTAFKRGTAQFFYKIMKACGAETVYNHADYRLLSNRVLNELKNYKEVNVYLRGMIPLIGFKSTCVPYVRNTRVAGKSKYPVKKMLGLAVDGITSLSIKPIRIITGLGLILAVISLLGVVWSFVSYFTNHTVAGWASIVSIICLFCGIQLLSIGVIGEYVGKIYLETKARPRFIISETTNKD